MKFTAVTLALASLAATVVAENKYNHTNAGVHNKTCLLYTSPSPRDRG